MVTDNLTVTSSRGIHAILQQKGVSGQVVVLFIFFLHRLQDCTDIFFCHHFSL